jgi:hypothetical protein
MNTWIEGDAAVVSTIRHRFIAGTAKAPYDDSPRVSTRRSAVDLESS